MLGNVFISWICLIYTFPQACISINGIQSSFFSLSHGTRQGCPLSPLLFALAIEPLSIYLRFSSTFTGKSHQMLQMFYQSVVASVLFYAAVCWGGRKIVVDSWCINLPLQQISFKHCTDTAPHTLFVQRHRRAA